MCPTGVSLYWIETFVAQTSIQRVAIVGAGLSGLVCARQLQAAGLGVCLFDKSRGLGGRMATRRVDGVGEFDHGAQYFTVSDPSFRSAVTGWLEAGVCAEWQAKIAVARHGDWRGTSDASRRFVGTPTMTAIAKWLAEPLVVERNARIVGLERHDIGWSLIAEDGRRWNDFDAVLLTAPAPQTRALLPPSSALTSQVAEISIAPCWSALLAFEQPLPLEFDGAFVEDSALSWICRQNGRPGRLERFERWVLHASPAWSQDQVDLPAEDARVAMLNAFWEATGVTAVEPSYQQVHRWLYSLPTNTLRERALFDEGLGLGVAGDWCGGPKIEGAYLSGLALSRLVTASA